VSLKSSSISFSTVGFERSQTWPETLPLGYEFCNLETVDLTLSGEDEETVTEAPDSSEASATENPIPKFDLH